MKARLLDELEARLRQCQEEAVKIRYANKMIQAEFIVQAITKAVYACKYSAKQLQLQEDLSKEQIG